MEQCLRIGFFIICYLKGVITGSPQAGKSSLLACLFNIGPTSIPSNMTNNPRTSGTRICMSGVRDISHKIIQERNSECFLLSYEGFLESINQAICKGMLKLGDLTQVVNLESLTSVISPFPYISTTKQEMAMIIIQDRPAMQNILELNLMHFIDSGGQPQFHQVLPAFAPNMALIILVLNLSEPLDARSQIEICEKSGETHREECSTLLSTEEIFEHQARTLQHMRPSELNDDSKTKLVVVGTHRDKEEQMIKEGKCKETRAEKNNKLLSMFSCLLSMLILFRTPNEVIFPINLLNPNDDDKEVLKCLRQNVLTADLFLKAKIPYGWFLLEQDIQRFAEVQGRNVVLVSECEKVAKKFYINSEVLQTALHYYHSLNIYLYNPNVLPGLVFVDPQVPLNCVWKIVEFQIKISRGSAMAIRANDSKNLKEGIMSLQFMKSEHFSENFTPGIFSPEHAFKLFQSLFIAAPLGKDLYLMPFLLPMIPKQKLHKHIPSVSFPAALWMLFKNAKSFKILHVPNGVFCGLVACLLLEYKWSSQKPDCMARNIVTLTCSPYPVKMTLVNMYTHFEIHLDASEAVLRKLCPKLQSILFKAVKGVMQAFNYTNSYAVIAFHCPYCTVDQGPKHAAEPSEFEGEKYLCCTERHSFSQLAWEEKYEIWGTMKDFHSSECVNNSKISHELSCSTIQSSQG